MSFPAIILADLCTVMKYLLPLLFLLTGLYACKKQEIAPPAGDPNFSIHQYAWTQWVTHLGTPYTFERILVLNGQRDTNYVAAMKMDWTPIFRIFFAADIGHPKFTDQYELSSFEDNTTVSIHEVYEAKDPTLFTRTMHISADQDNPQKILSIYIETQKKDGYDVTVQRLLYTPLKKIQIEETTSSKFGPDKEFLVEYRFL